MKRIKQKCRSVYHKRLKSDYRSGGSDCANASLSKEDPPTAEVVSVDDREDHGDAPYEYPPMHDQNSTRVLCLQPGSADDQLRGTLKIISLEDDDLEFEAVSYVWGPADFPRTIILDGRTLPITESLFLALQTFRLADGARYLWADAICINQYSLDERNHQITLMYRIYTRCTRCLAYLGPAADGSETVPKFIDSIWEWVHSDAWSSAPSWKKGPIFSARPRAGLPDREHEGWQSLVNFFVRPWFRRLWIIQEAVLPEEVVLHCGSWSMGANELYVFRLLLSVYKFAALFDQDIDESLNNLFIKTWTNIEAYTNFRACKGRPCGLPMDQLQAAGLQSKLQMRRLLNKTSFCEVTDPKDRFYALYGLADDLDPNAGVTPDYSKSLEEVVDDFVRFFVNNGQGADLLVKVETNDAKLAPPLARPSWMWDWHDMSIAENTGNVRAAALKSCKLEADSERWFKSVTLLSKSQLSVRGYLVDAISCRTDRTNDLSQEFFDEAVKLAYDPSKNATLSSVEDECYRTMILDSTHDLDSTPAPLEYIALCKRRIGWNPARMYGMLYDEEWNFQHDIAEQNGYAELGLRHSTNAAFGITQSSHFGAFPACARPGDQVFIIDGGVKTFLVRHQPEDDTYLWLGSVFVYDLEERINEVIKSDAVAITLN